VKHVVYIRAHADGEVYSGPGQCDEFAFEHLRTLPGAEDLIVLPVGNPARMNDKIDRKTLKVIRKGPPKQAAPRAAASEPEPITIEELTDAVIKLAEGDRSVIDGIALRRKRQIKKAEKSDANTGGSVKRSAGRDKGASK
jgi:hypothetical protein